MMTGGLPAELCAPHTPMAARSGATVRAVGVAVIAGIVLLWGKASPATGREWSGQAHGLLAVGVDSNPLDSLACRQHRVDLLTRLEAGVTADRASDGVRPGVHGGLRWGIDRYLRERSQHRALTLGELALRWDLRRSWIECAWIGSARNYPHQSRRDARRHEIRARGAVGLSARNRFAWSAWGVGAQTQPGGPSARRGAGLGLDFSRTFSRCWLAGLAFEPSIVRYDRRALAFSPEGGTLLRAEDQEDQAVLIGMRLSRTAAPLAALFVGWRNTTSNSLGSAYRRLETSLWSAWILPWRASLQIQGQWHWAHYADDLRPINPREDPDDPDFGERNGVTLRLRRALRAGWIAELQGSWQRDESLLRREYYDKLTLLAALQFSSQEP